MAPHKKYPMVAKQVVEEIKSGRYQVGEVFPNLDEMAKIYGISRVTAYRALTLLVQGEYVSVGRGRKSIVLDRRPQFQSNGSTPKTIAVLADFSMNINLGNCMNLVYPLMDELRNKGTHVVCIQYCSGMDFRTDDMDAYIAVDLLGIYRGYHRHLRNTGKPFVCIGYLRNSDVQPNQLQILPVSAMLEFTSRLLADNTVNYIFCLPDRKPIRKHLGETEARELKNWLDDDLIKRFTAILQNHGNCQRQIQVHVTDAEISPVAKSVNKIFRNSPQKTAVIAMSDSINDNVIEELEKHDIHLNRDYHVMLADSINSRESNDARKLHTPGISFPELLDKIIWSLDYQMTASNNYCPAQTFTSELLPPTVSPAQYDLQI